MKQDVVAPSVGESITEVSILKWHKGNGEAVKNGDLLIELESDKATVEVVAESDGALTIVKEEGETVPIGELLATIDTDAKGTAPSATVEKTAALQASAISASAASSAPAAIASDSNMGPAAKKMAAEKGIDPSAVAGTGKGGRVTKGDLMAHQTGSGAQAATSAQTGGGARPAASVSAAPASSATAPRVLREGERRVKMSRLRQTIARRLVSVQQEAAILTTFNDVNMAPIMEIRKEHKEAFKEKNGVPLSFMSFFIRACAEALKEIEAVNASIDGTDMIYHDFKNIGIAVGTDKGLVVPVIRNTGSQGFVDLEKSLAAVAAKARNGKLSIDDMTGGTFTISNGGVYGSMLSTPILNPPQSAILGMHKIEERPVAENGKVVIRPMMYLALSYDHRIIDGKEAVTFLVKVREGLENPAEKLGWSF